MPGLLIVNADDFGASLAVNEAVVLARREGVLTSASLMVVGEASDDAAVIARDDPELAVGLHVVVSHLPDPVRAGFALSFSHAARARARASIARQFEAFIDMGLDLSHVDGHQHLHAHPAVLPFIARLAEQYGANGIRVPCEPLLQGLRIDRTRPTGQLALSLGQAYLRRACSRCLRKSSLATPDRTIGGLMSGRMSTDYVIRMLNTVQAGSVEVYFHPCVEHAHPYGPNPGDLQALIDPALARYVREFAWELTTYAGLRAAREVETSDRG